MTGHTKEPWALFTTARSTIFPGQDGSWLEIKAGKKVLAEVFEGDDHADPFEAEANARRIVACVNALATIPDPQAFMEAARGMREALAALGGRHRAQLYPAEFKDAREALAAFDAAQGEQ